jgi:hypothetical protein
MVAYSGTTVCADRLRPLNRPRPIHVETDDRGYPVTVGFSRPFDPFDKLRMSGGLKTGVTVAEILDRWRIDDEWWRPALQGDATVGRAEISRMYYHVALRNRQLLVIFRDLTEDSWYAQTNATPLNQPEPLDVLTPIIPAAASVASASPSDQPAPIPRIGIVGA